LQLECPICKESFDRDEVSIKTITISVWLGSVVDPWEEEETGHIFLDSVICPICLETLFKVEPNDPNKVWIGDDYIDDNMVDDVLEEIFKVTIKDEEKHGKVQT
jgi:uncharacterized protein (DUF2225 family)